MCVRSKSMVLCCTEAMGIFCTLYHVHSINPSKMGATSDNSSTPVTNDPVQIREVMLDLNSCIHQQVRKFLTDDAAMPFQFDTLDIDAIISEMHPQLWSAICSLTQSVSECRGTSKVSDSTTHVHNVKKVRGWKSESQKGRNRNVLVIRLLSFQQIICIDACRNW